MLFQKLDTSANGCGYPYRTGRLRAEGSIPWRVPHTSRTMARGPNPFSRFFTLDWSFLEAASLRFLCFRSRGALVKSTGQLRDSGLRFRHSSRPQPHGRSSLQFHGGGPKRRSRSRRPRRVLSPNRLSSDSSAEQARDAPNRAHQDASDVADSTGA